MDTRQTNFLTMPLSREDHKTALRFSLQQDTVEKGERVYLNTLAVLAVHSFLECLRIETDVEAGDSWHSIVRCFHDVADLVIPNIGRVECRPVLPGETVISLPVEVTEDRIAYIGVQFQEQLNEVQLLGFCRAIDSQPEEIEIASLEPIENLIDHIDCIESAILESSETSQIQQHNTNPIVITIPGRIKLDNWLKNIDSLLEMGFQTLENYLSILQGDQVFRYSNAPRSRKKETEKASISITGVKEVSLAEYNLTLVVSCQPENDQAVNIILRLYPTGDNIHLPPSVKLMILDDSEEIFLEAIARSSDNWMQLEFSGELGEDFIVRVAIDNSSIDHNFTI